MNYSLRLLKKYLKESEEQAFNLETVDLSNPQTPSDHIRKYVNHHQDNYKAAGRAMIQKATTLGIPSHKIVERLPEEYKKYSDLEDDFHNNKTLNIMGNPNTPTELLIKHMTNTPAHEEAFWNNPTAFMAELESPGQLHNKVVNAASHIKHPESFARVFKEFNDRLDYANQEKEENKKKDEAREKATREEQMADFFKGDDSEFNRSYIKNNHVMELANSLLNNPYLAPENKLAIHSKTSHLFDSEDKNLKALLSHPLNRNVLEKLSDDYIAKNKLSSMYSKKYKADPFIQYLNKLPKNQAAETSS